MTVIRLSGVELAAIREAFEAVDRELYNEEPPDIDDDILTNMGITLKRLEGSRSIYDEGDAHLTWDVISYFLRRLAPARLRFDGNERFGGTPSGFAAYRARELEEFAIMARIREALESPMYTEGRFYWVLFGGHA